MSSLAIGRPSTIEFDHVTYPGRRLWWPRRRTVTLELSLSHCAVVETHATKAHKAERTVLSWREVLGAQIQSPDGQRLQTPTDVVDVDGTYRFVLSALPAKISRPSEPKRRELAQWSFEFPGRIMSDAVALGRWVNFLADPRSTEEVMSKRALDEVVLNEKPARKFLVLINPVSGTGKSVQLYKDQVAPIFEYANVEAEVKLTERANHGVDIAKDVSLTAYDAIVTVGGDGSLCEIVQGLMARPDWHEAIQLPLGVIPSGSGNGLFGSLMHAHGEYFDTINAVFALAKGVAQSLDIAAVRNPFGDIMYSFLTSEWALVADVDVDSEKMRYLGVARFTVAALHHILLLRRIYEGTIWYLEDDPNAAYQPVPYKHEKGADRLGFDLFDKVEEGALASDGSSARWRKIDSGFHLVWVCNTTHPTTDSYMAPGAAIDDGYTYLVLLDGKHPRKDLINFLLSMDTGGHVDTESTQIIKSRAFRIEPANKDDVICVDGEVFRGPIETQVHHKVARVLTLPREAALGA
ncbi:hypothetical protein Poli38472_013116 [Pythium oligandrum]|uniref:DAGKc domain-containing protein n=1 Tax=Pythium oligandrum TaxID=41045 RepID=A0A8K1C2G1_PYTOL|nr:hypothetical protein Poli38472_013116 [Pythium oligandrum]|eukprot:TMW55225.1 hypothetical protein Poli38472_013116 [Pythium oligandrum]